MHIGQKIREILNEEEITVVSFARQLSYTRTNIYKILDKKSIDTDLLLRICVILEHDFFSDYQNELHTKNTQSPYDVSPISWHVNLSDTHNYILI